MRVEPDWSSAAYPLVAAAILGRSVRVPGLREDSHQADARVLELLRTAGVRCGVDSKGAWCRGTGRVRPFRIDIRGSPDLGPAAAALALFAEGESRITGALAIHLKESNRMEACIAAIRSLGGRAAGIHHTVVKVAPRPGISDRRSLADGLVVRGGTPRAGTVDSRGDHRIALAFGVAAAAIPGARVLRRGCVAKSWPGAWDDLAPLLRGGSRVVSLPRPSGRG